MSHFTKVKTKIKDLGLLKKALESLGINYEEAEQGRMLAVKGWEGNVAEAPLVINSGCSYGIGMVETNDGFELKADWWAIETYTLKTREDILCEIEKKYAYETVMDKINAQGYSLVTEEDDNESIRLVVRRWV